MKQRIAEAADPAVEQEITPILQSAVEMLASLTSAAKKYAMNFFTEVAYSEKKDNNNFSRFRYALVDLVDGLPIKNAISDNFSNASLGDIPSFKRALEALREPVERARAIDEGRTYDPAEGEVTLRLIEALRSVKGDSNAVREASWESYSSVSEALGKVVQDDPQVERDDSVAYLQKTVSICFGMYGTDAAQKEILATVAKLDAMALAIKESGSEEFNRFVERFKEVVKPVLALIEMWDNQDYKDFKQDIENVGLDPEGLGEIPWRIKQGSIMQELDRKHATSTVLPRNVLLKKFKEGEAENFLARFSEACAATLARFNKADAPSEAAPGLENPVFGKYVFAPVRRKDVPAEENTPEEQHAYDELRRHVADNTPMDDESALTLMQAMEDGAYPSIIHEPTSEYVFRGVALDTATLTKILGEKPSTEGSKLVTKWVGARGERQGSTGWSTNKTSALGFSYAREDKPYSVIFVARTKDNPDTFLEGPNGFYKVRPLGQYSSEKETIALGPAKIFKVYWRYSDYGAKIKDDAIEESRKLFRNFIKETLEDAAPEGLEDDPLGKYAFAKKRLDKKVPPEDDTSAESGLYVDLMRHFRNNKQVAPEAAAILRDLRKQGMYAAVIHPPTTKYVYRGINITRQQAWQMGIGDAVRRPASGGASLGGWTYVPTKGVDSWTTSPSSAAVYSGADSSNGRVERLRVVFVARVDGNEDSFISGPDGLYNVKGFDAYTDEDEVLCIGPIKVDKVYWAPSDAPPTVITNEIEERN